MRSRRRAYATAIALATFVFCLGAVTGRARDGDDEDARIMLFSGRDIWRHGGFAHGGFVFAPNGFDQDGLLLKLLLSGGFYRYRASDPEIGMSSASTCCPRYCRVGGSNAAMPNSKFSSAPNFRSIIFSRTILPTGCGVVQSAFGSRPNSGTSRRRKRCLRPMPRCHQLQPEIRRARLTVGAFLMTCWESM